MKKLALALIATFAFILSAHAETCRVADPTGTPLKYRSAPYGKVLGTLPNGTYVYINGYKEDKKAKFGCGHLIIKQTHFWVGCITTI